MTSTAQQDLIELDRVVNEGESADLIEVEFWDLQNPSLNPSAILSITADLVDEPTGAPINSRAAQDVLNTNGGTLTDTVFKFAMDPADAVIIDGDADNPVAAGGLEYHILRLTFTWNDGTSVRTGIQDYRFPVRKDKIA